MIKATYFQKKHLPILVNLLFLTSLSGCGQNKIKEADFLSRYGGDPYMGTVKVNVILPNGSTAKTDYGEGSVYFSGKEKGKAQIVVFGAISNKKGDAGFVMDGPYNGSAWKSEGSDKIKLEIGTDGAIKGGGSLPPQQFTFSGLLSEEDLNLITRVKRGDTIYVFTYNLYRKSTAVETGDKKSKATAAKKKCKKIVWQTRYIGHFDGSGSTIRVPVCMD